MPFDLLLPPLLGGYLFITRFNGTAYRCSGYSGYRLILSSSIAGLAFLLAAAGILYLLKLSSSPVFLHHLIASPAIVGLLLLLYGSWRLTKVTARPGERVETDKPGEFEYRERIRKQELIGVLAALALSVVGLLVVLWHVYWGLFLIHMPRFWLTLFVAVGVTAVVINVIKAHSELRGYQVAFRLGILWVIATLLFLLAFWGQEPIYKKWSDIVPFQYAGVSMLSFLLGAFLWLPANMLYPHQAAVERLIENGEVNGLEQLFHYAVITFQQVSVTLVDDKVYIGYVDGEIPIAGRTDNFVKIVPTVSGYRESPTKRLRITTSYLDAFEKAIQEDGADLSSSDLAKVIPIDQIRSAGIFDPTLYTEFQISKPENSDQVQQEAEA